MVAAVNLRQDKAVLDSVDKILSAEEIVDSPAYVSLSCGGTVAPPRVSTLFFRIEMAEGIYKTGSQELAELTSLLVGEAGAADILLWIFKIDKLMGDVHIAADDNRLCFVKLKKIGTEVILKAHTVVNSLKLRLSIG